MKGMVFNMLCDMVCDKFGLEVWDKILTESGLDGVYISSETYDDAEVGKLVAAAEALSGIPARQLLFQFGEHMLPGFKRKYPIFFLEDMNLKSFLLTVDKTIHVEVRKLHPDAALPEFDYVDENDGNLIMIYRSHRKLCWLAEGLLSGAASHFDTQYSLQHDTCMHNGDDHCVFDITMLD